MKINNKKIAKSVIAIALVASISTVAAFAQPKGNPSQRPHINQQTFDYEGKGPMRPPRPMNSSLKDEVLMGTIESVDEKSMIITIADSNGKDYQVHVNPMTRIEKMNPGKMEAPNDNPNAENLEHKRPEKLPTIEKLTLADLKDGTWVTIREFKTSGDAHEAAKVMIVEPQTPAELEA